MHILVLSDIESKSLWDYFDQQKLEGIDLILSCGDLKPQYLEFIATFAKVPILYIHGNHDACYEKTPPNGCICIEDTIYEYEGIRILGIGGSMRYKQGPFQFTQKEMAFRVKKLWWQLRKHKGFDILLTHSPAFQIDDDDDLPHQGFQAFVSLLDKYKPRYFIHGHVHMSYGRKFKRVNEYHGVTIINGYEKYVFEY